MLHAKKEIGIKISYHHRGKKLTEYDEVRLGVWSAVW